MTVAPEIRRPQSTTALYNPNDPAFEAIVAGMETLVSHAISAREAAWRCEPNFLKLHLLDVRPTLVDALAIFRQIDPALEGRPI